MNSIRPATDAAKIVAVLALCLVGVGDRTMPAEPESEAVIRAKMAIPAHLAECMMRGVRGIVDGLVPAPAPTVRRK